MYALHGLYWQVELKCTVLFIASMHMLVFFSSDCIGFQAPYKKNEIFTLKECLQRNYCVRIIINASGYVQKNVLQKNVCELHLASDISQQ